MASTGRWEHFEHGADIGIRGRAATEEGAFQQIALALTAIVTDPLTVRGGEAIAIDCEAPDHELLLIDWLNALVYEMSVRKMVFGRFAVRLDGQRLRGTAWGEPMDPDRHELAVEVKGATYTQLWLGQDSTGEWTAQCIVDV